MNTPLRFGGRHTLHAMAAGFKFQPTVNAVAAEFGDHLFETAVFTFVGAEDLHLPATRFRIAAVHAEQIAGKQRRFVTAGSARTSTKALRSSSGSFGNSSTCSAVAPAGRLFLWRHAALPAPFRASPDRRASSAQFRYPPAPDASRYSSAPHRSVEHIPATARGIYLIGNRRGIAEQRLHFFMALVQRFQFGNNRRLHRREFTLS